MYNIIDLKPFRSNFVGFDSIFDEMDRMLREPAEELSYPPFDLYKEDVEVAVGGKSKGETAPVVTETHYVFKFALAGVNRDRLSVYFDPETHVLEVKCDKPSDEKTESREYLHKGIAQRTFTFKRTINPDLELFKCSTAEKDGPGCLLVEFRKKDKPEAKSTKVEIQH